MQYICRLCLADHVSCKRSRQRHLWQVLTFVYQAFVNLCDVLRDLYDTRWLY